MVRLFSPTTAIKPPTVRKYPTTTAKTPAYESELPVKTGTLLPSKYQTIATSPKNVKKTPPAILNPFLS